MENENEDLDPADIVYTDGEEIELLRDVKRGLADIEAGRVVPHEEARARLLKIIATDKPHSDAERNAP